MQFLYFQISLHNKMFGDSIYKKSNKVSVEKLNLQPTFISGKNTSSFNIFFSSQHKMCIKSRRQSSFSLKCHFPV